MAARLIQKSFQQRSAFLLQQFAKTVSSRSTLQTINNHIAPHRCLHFSQGVFSKILYTETHEWLKLDGKEGTIGITDYAQEQLGDIVFCELPEVGTSFQKGDSFATIESVKAASDLYMPVAAEIIERNDAVLNEAKLINDSPFEQGWLVKIRMADDSSASDLSDLLTPEAYEHLK